MKKRKIMLRWYDPRTAIRMHKAVGLVVVPHRVKCLGIWPDYASGKVMVALEII